MNLSKHSKVLLQEKMREFFAGEISTNQYLTAVKAVYSLEFEVEHNKNLQGSKEWVKDSYRDPVLEQL